MCIIIITEHGSTSVLKKRSRFSIQPLGAWNSKNKNNNKISISIIVFLFEPFQRFVCAGGLIAPDDLKKNNCYYTLSIAVGYFIQNFSLFGIHAAAFAYRDGKTSTTAMFKKKTAVTYGHVSLSETIHFSLVFFYFFFERRIEVLYRFIHTFVLAPDQCNYKSLASCNSIERWGIFEKKWKGPFFFVLNSYRISQQWTCKWLWSSVVSKLIVYRREFIS